MFGLEQWKVRDLRQSKIFIRNKVPEIRRKTGGEISPGVGYPSGADIICAAVKLFSRQMFF